MDIIEVPSRYSADRKPVYGSKHASGADLRADIESSMVIEPGDRAIVPTGLFIEIPDGFEAQVRPRSGLAFKHGISVVNTPGTIDADYRGEIKIILINLGKEPFVINSGDRIAQLVFAPVVQASFVSSETLTETVRGAGGFGSTGRS